MQWHRIPKWLNEKVVALFAARQQARHKLVLGIIHLTCFQYRVYSIVGKYQEGSNVARIWATGLKS
ncbi:MAG: hypothetical protein JST86_01875 [Bacteroidetes bacterium]|nr:hypothetical protein [Bacteroidota bacterium]